MEEFAKAVTDIAEVLPRVKLNAQLYQTDRIKANISKLYAYILLFFKQILSWYQLSRTQKAISAFLNPFKLRLKTTVDEVKRCGSILDAAADSASRAETRSIHVLVQDMCGKITDVETRIDNLSTSLTDKLEVIACESHLHYIYDE